MMMSRNPLVVSLGLFTTIPVPAVEEIDRRTAGRAMAMFPLVGLVVGALAGAVVWAVAWLGGALLAAVFGLAMLAWLTGALHLDGLADTADGLGSRKSPEQALAIMRRSDIGPMGVLALLFVLLLDVAALSRIMAVIPMAGPPALMAAAVLGRVVVVWATNPAGRGARPEGFGALFHAVTSVTTIILWCIAGLVATGIAGWTVAGMAGAAAFGGAAVVAVGVGLLWRGHLTRRLGGMTGDTFGSLIEVVQTTFLVLVALCLAASSQLPGQ